MGTKDTIEIDRFDLVIIKHAIAYAMGDSPKKDLLKDAYKLIEDYQFKQQE